ATNRIFFIGFGLLFDRPQVRSHVVHLLVLRVVQSHHHFLVSLAAIFDVNFRKAGVWIPRHRLARTIFQRKNDDKVVLTYQSAFELRSVGKCHYRSPFSTIATSPSTSSSKTAASAGNPCVLERSRVRELRSNALEITADRMTSRTHR